MRRIWKKVIIAIAVYMFMWCFTVPSALRRDFLIPKWMKHLHNENFTGVPNSVVQLHNRMAYPTRLFLLNNFRSQNQLKISRKMETAQTPIPKSTDFYCDTNGTRSLSRPTSVHELRPGDIDVIGGIGDSLTVGTGSFSHTFPQLIVEHRGVSFTAGGQSTWREFLTIPNILKVFNPKLIGYAYGDSLAEQRSSQFNVAELGALSKDALFMTKELVKRIKMDKRVNVNEDWKLITLLLGSNTFCQELCYEDYKVIAEKHRKEFMDALLYIKENLPRTLVNLIMSPNLEFLKKHKNVPSYCPMTLVLECPCFMAKQYEHRWPDYVKVMNEFQQVEKEIVENEDLRNKDDFAVVLQTFTEEFKLPLDHLNNTDISYLSVDCFHLSQKGYARCSNALWNNMMEPVGRKSTNWSKEFDRFVCPTERFPYIRTWKNSLV